jgi:hypothetical protein
VIATTNMLDMIFIRKRFIVDSLLLDVCEILGGAFMLLCSRSKVRIAFGMRRRPRFLKNLVRAEM